MSIDVVKLCQKIVTNPYTDWPARYPGRRPFGYLCTYVPEEILHAAGFTPVRVLPRPGPITRADAHLQSYSCCFARGCLDLALRHELDDLAGVVFAHTCDTMQGLADIWEECFKFQVPASQLQPSGSQQAPPTTWHIVAPVTLSSPYALDYLVGELRAFIARLEQHFGIRVTDEALTESIRLYNRHRRLLSALYAHRDQYRSDDIFYLVTAGMLMPKEEHMPILETILSNLAVRSGDFSRSQSDSIPGGTTEVVTTDRAPVPVRLVVSGATVDDPALMTLIEEVGGRVVADDLCTGLRYFDTLVEESGDPLVALARRSLNRLPCPCKARGLNTRPDHLVQLVRDHRAAGVLFLHKKFCDPHAWDYVPLAAALDAAGIPHLLLETDAITAIGQVQVRLEAFLEMVNG